MAREYKYSLDVPQIPDGEPIILFRAQDKALPMLLETYAVLCLHLGSPLQHVEHIRAIRENVIKWQTRNPDKIKAPD